MDHQVCGKSHKECRGKKKVYGCPLIQAGVTKILLTLMHATINAALYVCTFLANITTIVELEGADCRSIPMT